MASSQIFHDHVRELRKRILWVVLSIGISAGISYALRIRIISLLQRPLGTPLFYTSPAGSFNFVLKLSMVIGIFIALPVMIYHLLRFIEPALPVRIKKGFMIKVIGASFLLALAGCAFGYFYMIPMSLKFFAGYSTGVIKPLISANEYLSYMTSNLFIFALVFQIPLLVLFINWIKPIKPRKLLHYQRHVIVGSFGLAIILPFTYDPISQFIVAIPIIVLYYVSVILLLIANRDHRSREKAQPKVQFEIKQPPSGPTRFPISSVPATPARRLSLQSNFSTEGIIRSPRAASASLRSYSPTLTRPAPVIQDRRIYKPMPRHNPISIDGISPLRPLSHA